MESATVSVRLATVADAEFLVRGNASMALETEGLSLDLDRLRDGVHNLFEDAARGFYLIAEAEGRRAGQMMITYEWSDWRNANFWWIQSVWVEPQFRRRGVFRALYQSAESRDQSRRQRVRAPPICGVEQSARGGNLSKAGHAAHCL